MDNIYIKYNEHINGYLLQKIKKTKEGIIELNYDENKENNTPFSLEKIKLFLNEIKNININKLPIKIKYHMSTDYILDTNKCKELEKIDNYLRENNTQLYISQKYAALTNIGFRQAITANRKLDLIADKIKKTNYSNFEKFMLAYEFVTDYIYKQANINDESYISKNWIPIMEDDKIVCLGYASLLEALCDRIFDESEVKVAKQHLIVARKDKKNSAGHANNLIFIKDEKYNINGMFYVDSCWDSRTNNDDNKPFSFCCIPLKDILYEKSYDFSFEYNITDFYLMQFEKYKNNNLNKNKFLEKIVEYFFDKNISNSALSDYCLKHFNDSTETKRIEINNKNEIEEIKKLDLKYEPLIKPYKNIEIFINNKTLKKLNLDKYIYILEDSNDQEKIKISINKIYTIISENINELKETKDKYPTSFKQIVLDSIKRKEKFEITEKYKDIETKNNPINKQNIQSLKNNLPKLVNVEPIPIKAFFNSFKIIGKEKGLKENELNEYAKSKLLSSIERTHEIFDVTQCKNCFATTKIEDIEKGAIKIK